MRRVIGHASAVYLKVFSACEKRSYAMTPGWSAGAAEGNFKSNLHFLFAFCRNIRCHFFVFFACFCFSFHFMHHGLDFRQHTNFGLQLSSLLVSNCEHNRFRRVVVVVAVTQFTICPFITPYEITAIALEMISTARHQLSE